MWKWDVLRHMTLFQVVAGIFATLATVLSLHLIYKHLRNYTVPPLQRHIVRILFMVPIYAIDSFISLKYPDVALYFDLFRDMYEAYVLYEFFALLITFINTYEDIENVEQELEQNGEPQIHMEEHTEEEMDQTKEFDEQEFGSIPISLEEFHRMHTEELKQEKETHVVIVEPEIRQIPRNSSDGAVLNSNSRKKMRRRDGEGRNQLKRSVSEVLQKQKSITIALNPEFDPKKQNSEAPDEAQYKRQKEEITKDLRSTVSEREERVVRILNTKPPIDHTWPLKKCLPKIELGKSFLMLCKRCILQFVIMKPLMGVLIIILEHYGWYDDGSFSPTRGFIYITIVQNISITIAMYFLVLFYQATKTELEPFNPVPKFLCIKAVLFLSFWQGVILAILSKSGIIHGGLFKSQMWDDRDVSNGLQDFLICIEMFVVSLAHGWTFSYAPYKKPMTMGEKIIPCYSFWVDCFCCCFCCCEISRNLGHVISQRDVVSESAAAFGVDQVPAQLGKMSGKMSDFAAHGVDVIVNNKWISSDSEDDPSLDSDQTFPPPPLTMEKHR